MGNAEGEGRGHLKKRERKKKGNKRGRDIVHRNRKKNTFEKSMRKKITVSEIKVFKVFLFFAVMNHFGSPKNLSVNN